MVLYEQYKYNNTDFTSREQPAAMLGKFDKGHVCMCGHKAYVIELSLLLWTALENAIHSKS